MKTPIATHTLEAARLDIGHQSDGDTRLPEFVRLPPSGKKCPVSSLSRGALNALILGPNPPVKSACLRRKGATRGIRLIVTSSLLSHLRSLVAKEAAPTASASSTHPESANLGGNSPAAEPPRNET